MGQFFGGRSVVMAGIGGLAIDQSERGRGTAKALMIVSKVQKQGRWHTRGLRPNRVFVFA